MTPTGMLRIIRATFRNFMSYGNVDTTVSFDTPNATMIVGVDLDNTSNGQGSNGVGKTTILNAVVYGLYDRIIENDVNKDSLVNNVNKRDMMVEVEFISKKGDHCIVTRMRKTKAGAAGNTTKFIVNGDDITRDSDGTNLLIKQFVGMPFELFIRIVVIPAMRTPFLDLPSRAINGSSQTAVLEELFNITFLSDRAKQLKANIAATEAAIKTEQQRINHVTSSLNAHTAQIASVQARLDQWDIATATKIVTIAKQLNLMTKVDVEAQYALSQQAVSIQASIRDMQQRQRQLELEFRQSSSRYLQLRREVAELEHNVCPYCQQSYQDTADKLNASQSEMATLEASLLEKEDQLSLVATELAEASAAFDRVNSQITVSNIGELMQAKQAQSELEYQLADLQSASNPYVEVLAELNASTVNFEIDHTELNSLKNVCEHQNFLLKLLTKTNSFIRKALLDQNIPYLNDRLSHYLTRLGLKYKVEFTADMSAVISILGRQIGFGNLSAGQKARVNLAISFAFRSVGQRFGCPVNICMLDETLDVGLDVIGVQSAARMLKAEAADNSTSLFIISHREELYPLFDRQIRVEFQAGFSRIPPQ